MPISHPHTSRPIGSSEGVAGVCGDGDLGPTFALGVVGGPTSWTGFTGGVCLGSEHTKVKRFLRIFGFGQGERSLQMSRS